jgi:short-subunit dehydrogenase
MPFDPRGQRVLVTGASSGIGAELAEQLAKRGATVGLVARRADRLAEVLERCQAHAPDSRMWVADLADPAAVEDVAAKALAELGRVDVLVNNAGIPKRRRVAALDLATVENVMRINYLAAVQLTLALLPQMLERNSGRIVNLASVAATLSPPGESAYAASKAALAVFSESMAVDLWDTGIKVTVVYPGVVDTELFTLPDNDEFVAQIPFITTEECAGDIIAALESDAIQVYSPAWFGDITPRKAADVAAFLAGTAEHMKKQRDAVS